MIYILSCMHSFVWCAIDWFCSFCPSFIHWLLFHAWICPYVRLSIHTSIYPSIQCSVSLLGLHSIRVFLRLRYVHLWVAFCTKFGFGSQYTNNITEFMQSWQKAWHDVIAPCQCRQHHTLCLHTLHWSGMPWYTALPVHWIFYSIKGFDTKPH